MAKELYSYGTFQTVRRNYSKEYTEISELKNSTEKPQIIIQQAPQAGQQAAEPAKDGQQQETPPEPPEPPQDGSGKKEGVKDAD